MNIDKFKKSMEKKAFKNLEEVFIKAKLSQEERDVFHKYERYCKYRLLRSKRLEVISLSEKPSFIKNIATGLVNLQSEKVEGAKDKFVKEMFSGKEIHKIEKSKTGIRSKINSQKILTAYFELELISFFLSHGFYIKLSKTEKNGQKIPEFVAAKDGLKINIEAKYLDIDKIADNRHGDVFVDGINHRMSHKEKIKGLERNMKMLERNYKNAMKKHKHIPEKEYYLVFINTYHLGYMGQPTINFFKEIPKYWTKQQKKNLLGIIIVGDKTSTIINTECGIDIIKLIPSIEKFHEYRISKV